MRIAVISDIHAAALPFRKALIDARAAGFDQLILLGDLLTYGIEPQLCLDLAREAISKDRAVLIGGNHDLLYQDLSLGRSQYASAMPEWLQESVYWTMGRIGNRWPVDIPWSESWTYDEAFFAHANPFGFGDWTYMRDEQDLERAAARLAVLGFRWGIFGHLHRPVSYRSNGVAIHVVGSIGQPRSREHPCPQWAMVHVNDATLTIQSHPVAFDATAQRTSIQATSALSQATRDILCGYFV
ncbi:putative phosphodiesterase [Novosphingobium hassiacum]|uniref:Putative phosphodiesterase n=1 Tax=Novosphingobium hassiacum TaxID=173676 RepID=A0A7W5ZZX7_9SPHN|nr:metallophosphoesterase family protein [Novosphingobium hassiacum]MBB3862571.1 putative phosphodiesterase [Novosphingobium hassiacum]